MTENKKKQAEKEEQPKEDNRLQETIELLQRTQANFENFKKQTEKRVLEIKEMAAKETLLKILPITDNFELALKNANCNQKEFIKGIELIYSQLFSALEESGVKVIETEEKEFDPHFHEALMKVNSEYPENIIIEEFQKGFTLHNKVIRHAKVKVSAGKTEFKENEKTNEN